MSCRRGGRSTGRRRGRPRSTCGMCAGGAGRGGRGERNRERGAVGCWHVGGYGVVRVRLPCRSHVWGWLTRGALCDDPKATQYSTGAAYMRSHPPQPHPHLTAPRPFPCPSRPTRTHPAPPYVPLPTSNPAPSPPHPPVAGVLGGSGVGVAACEGVAVVRGEPKAVGAALGAERPRGQHSAPVVPLAVKRHLGTRVL